MCQILKSWFLGKHGLPYVFQSFYHLQNPNLFYTHYTAQIDDCVFIKVVSIWLNCFQFEFVTAGDGVFQIHAKFMGVNLEHVEVDIQVRNFTMLLSVTFFYFIQLFLWMSEEHDQPKYFLSNLNGKKQAQRWFLKIVYLLLYYPFLFWTQTFLSN